MSQSVLAQNGCMWPARPPSLTSARTQPREGTALLSPSHTVTGVRDPAVAGPPQARASPRPAPANPGTHLRGSTDRGPRDRAHRVKGSQGGTGLAGEKAGGHSGQRGQRPMGFPGSKCPEVSSGASWRSGRKAARMPAVSMLTSTGSPGTPSSGAGPRARAGGPQGGPPLAGDTRGQWCLPLSTAHVTHALVRSPGTTGAPPR